MGAFLDKPKTEKYNESKAGAGMSCPRLSGLTFFQNAFPQHQKHYNLLCEGLRYGLSSMQGWRIEMEDAHSAVLGIPDVGENVSWFAVFDGHAGSRLVSFFLVICVMLRSKCMTLLTFVESLLTVQITFWIVSGKCWTAFIMLTSACEKLLLALFF